MALKESLLQSIKRAMQGEMDSITIYKNAANHTTDTIVKEFFASRSEEERLHYNYLLQYYQEISNDIIPTDISKNIDMKNNFNPIISETFLKRIGQDQILFSAISTALLLEKDAIDHYRKCQEETELLTLKSFFGIMVKWESKHYDELLNIQKESETYYWQINQFEPF